MTTMDGTVQVPHRLRAPFRLERAELRKLHLRDRVQAVVLAYEAGLVRPGPSL